jgi:hypothetical protein
MIRSPKDIVAAAHEPCFRFEPRLRAINPPGEDVMATDFASTFLACGGIFLLSFFMIWAFWFVERLRGTSAPGWESKA